MDRLAQCADAIGREHRHRLGLVVVVVDVRSVRFHADRVYARVWTDAAGHLPQPVEDVGIHRIERLGTRRFSHAAALRNGFNRDYSSSTEQEGAANGKLPDRTATPDGNGVARLDVAVLGRHVACLLYT